MSVIPKDEHFFESMNLSFLKTRIIRWILVAVLFLTTVAAGTYYYIQREQKLTFHHDWTEMDRKQMQEIMSFLKLQKESVDRIKDKGWKEFTDSLSFSKIGDWKGVLSNYRKWREEYHDVWNPFSYLDGVVVRTARTGNACYVGADDWTLLHLACGLGKKELACHLIEKGADVNIRYRRSTKDGMVLGDMPLHYIFSGGMDSRNPMDAETVLFLMEKLAARGADFNARSAGEIMLPFELLCLWGNRYTEEEQEKIISRLIALGADVVSPVQRERGRTSSFQLPVQFGRRAVVRHLCEAGANVNEGYDFIPPLFFVHPVRSDNMQEVARILLDHGAQINGRILRKSFDESSMDMGQTPLSCLCSNASDYYPYNEKQKKNFLDLLSLYLERKADVNLESESGMTPLMYLFKRKGADKNRKLVMEMACLLLKHGADPSLKNGKGETVLDMIRKNTDDEKEILAEIPELQPGKSKGDASHAK